MQIPSWSQRFHDSRRSRLAWAIIVYGLAASVLPVWLLLAPRDYLSTFMKLGTIFALVLGIFLVLPDLQMPARQPIHRWLGAGGGGQTVSVLLHHDRVRRDLRISHPHLQRDTPKIITRENYARPIGYGAMCLESLVAIMALIAACTLEPGVYLSMNIKGAGATEPAIARYRAKGERRLDSPSRRSR